MKRLGKKGQKETFVETLAHTSSRNSLSFAFPSSPDTMLRASDCRGARTAIAAAARGRSAGVTPPMEKAAALATQASSTTRLSILFAVIRWRPRGAYVLKKACYRTRYTSSRNCALHWPRQPSFSKLSHHSVVHGHGQCSDGSASSVTAASVSQSTSHSNTGKFSSSLAGRCHGHGQWARRSHEPHHLSLSIMMIIMIMIVIDSLHGCPLS